jgi:hypothetical protein
LCSKRAGDRTCLAARLIQPVTRIPRALHSSPRRYDSGPRATPPVPPTRGSWGAATADYQITLGPRLPGAPVTAPLTRAVRILVDAAMRFTAPSITRPSTTPSATCANAALPPSSSRSAVAATRVPSGARRRSCPSTLSSVSPPSSASSSASLPSPSSPSSARPPRGPSSR